MLNSCILVALVAFYQDPRILKRRAALFGKEKRAHMPLSTHMQDT